MVGRAARQRGANCRDLRVGQVRLLHHTARPLPRKNRSWDEDGPPAPHIAEPRPTSNARCTAGRQLGRGRCHQQRCPPRRWTPSCRFYAQRVTAANESRVDDPPRQQNNLLYPPTRLLVAMRRHFHVGLHSHQALRCSLTKASPYCYGVSAGSPLFTYLVQAHLLRLSRWRLH